MARGGAIGKTRDGRRIERAYDSKLRENGVRLGYRIKEPVPHCWMCSRSDSPRTNEHIFPQWALELLDVRGERYGTMHKRFAGPVINSRDPIPFQNLVNGQVCSRCNSGWMSDLEAQFKAVAFDSLRIGPISHAEALVVARWFAKTAVVMNTSLNWRLLYAARFRHQARTRVPAHTTVFLGTSAPSDEPPLWQCQTNPMLGRARVGEEALLRHRTTCSPVSIIKIGHLTGTVVHAPAGGTFRPQLPTPQLWPPVDQLHWDNLPSVELSKALILGDPHVFASARQAREGEPCPR